jgi:hypothetical protein
MNASLIAVIAFVGILATTFLGMRLRIMLPDHHLSADTKETVRVGMGLVATMTALLLGLLIATAKGSYDTQRSQVIQVAAKVGFIDRILTIYGPETVESRKLLRASTEDLVKILWRDNGPQTADEDPAISSSHAFYSSIQKLTPQTDEQRDIKSEALSALTDVGKTRWLLFAQSDTSIPTPLLIMVIVWLAIIFLSFGLFAPTNKTVIVIMIIVTLLVSSALFLILELDRPFDGVIQVSSAPMNNVLSRMDR